MLNTEFPTLLTPPEAAAALRTTVKTLAVWRCTKRHGVPFIKVGRKIWYDRAALKQYLAAKAVNSVDQRDAA